MSNDKILSETQQNKPPAYVDKKDLPQKRLLDAVDYSHQSEALVQSGSVDAERRKRRKARNHQLGLLPPDPPSQPSTGRVLFLRRSLMAKSQPYSMRMCWQ